MNTNTFLSRLRAFLFATCLVSAVTGVSAQSIEVRQQSFTNDVTLPFGKAASTASSQMQRPRDGAVWDIRLQDLNLANTFQRWSVAAGWRVRWDARKNVMIEAPDQLHGSFEDAIRQVLESPGIAYSAYPLEVCFYPNTPPLARVTLKGEQDKECK